ncbi:hypothetical protein Tco_0898968 [Tanacetum coccineum]
MPEWSQGGGECSLKFKSWEICLMTPNERSEWGDSSKSMYLYKLVINDEMIDYVLEKYGNKWQVDDVISNEILNDLLKREFNKQQRVKDEKGKMTKEKRPLKDDKRKLTGIKIAVDLEKRIQNVEIDLNKAKEKMLMERDTSSSSDDIPPSIEILETSSDDIPPITHPL